jgi:hypothetical protein
MIRELTNYRLTVINFTLPLNLKFESESEYNKYLRETYLPIHYLSKKSNPNTDKLNIFKFDLILRNIGKGGEKPRSNYSEFLKISRSTLYFTIFICKYTIKILLNGLRIYHK